MGLWWWCDGCREGPQQLPCGQKHNLSHKQVSDTEVSPQITTRAYEMKEITIGQARRREEGSF